MRKALCLAGGLLAWTSCRGVEESPPAGPGKSRASALVDLLAHEDAGVRAEAEASLAGMGEEAQAELLAAMDAPNPERSARARRLYRRLAISKLELLVEEAKAHTRDSSFTMVCSLRNGSSHPLVVVGVDFHEETRVLWSTAREEGFGWKAERWRHGCSDVHPFEEGKDFVSIPPGESRYVGWFHLEGKLLPPGRHRVVAKYVFRRPERIDPRYFPTPRLHRLYEAAVETDGIRSAPFEIEVGAAKSLKE